MSTLNCTVATPERKVYSGAARFVVVPAEDGELGILPRHAPLIGALGCGELRLEPEGGARAIRFFVNGGFLEVRDDEVAVLAAEAVPTDDLDPETEGEQLRALAASPPSVASGLEAREAHRRQLEVARARLRIARGGRLER